MAYRLIAPEEDPRGAHFAYFRSLAYPYLGVTAEVDVTDAADYCRRHGVSFYLAVMHAAALAADEVAPLRRRIRNGQIAEYDECPTSHIELLEDGTYCYCTLRHHMELPEYFARAAESRKLCRAKGITEDDDAESMYFISSLPWIRYSALIQPVGGGEDSNPRITWGKYEENGAGRLMLPLSVLAHHALVDGVHIAQFYDRLERQLAALYRP